MFEFTYIAYNNLSVYTTSRVNGYNNEPKDQNQDTTYVGSFGYGGSYYVPNRSNEVYITVRAETPYEAELKAKNLVIRQVFELQVIKELRDD